MLEFHILILGLAERILSLKNIRLAVEKIVTEWLRDSQVSIQNVKVEFLASLADCFPKYFNETYEAVWIMKHHLISNNEDQVGFIQMKKINMFFMNEELFKSCYSPGQ